MNTYIMTITDALVGPASLVPVSPRQEPGREAIQSSDFGDEKRLQPNARQSTTTDNRGIDSQNDPINDAPRNFRQALQKEEDCSSLHRRHRNTKSQEQPIGSKAANRPELVESWLTQNPEPLDSTKTNSTIKNESKSWHRLAELIDRIKTEKFTPVKGRTVSTVEIKLLESKEKILAGLKTVLSQKSQGQNRVKLSHSDSPKGISNKQTLTSITDSISKTLAKKTGSTEVFGAEKSGQSAVVSKISIANPHPNIIQPKAPYLQHLVAAEPKKSGPAIEVKAAFHNSGGEREKKSLSDQLKGKNHTGKEVVNDLSFRKPNTTTAQVDIVQAKNHATTSGNSSPYQEIAQIVSQSGEHTQTNTSSFTAYGVNTSSPHILQGSLSTDISTDVGKQILESIHTSISQQAAEKQLTVRLNPPELGQVFIKLKEQDMQITGVLEVSKAQTKLEIEQALPEMTRNLAASGIQVNRIEVVFSVSEHIVENDSEDTLLNNSMFQQQGSSDSGSTENSSETDDSYQGSSNDGAYRHIAEFREMSISGGSINILI